MEVNATTKRFSYRRFKEWASEIFLKEARPFVSKRDINVHAVMGSLAVATVIAITVILFLPTKPPLQVEGSQESSSTSFETAKSIEESTPTQDAVRQLEEANRGIRQTPKSLDYLYSQSAGGSMGSKPNDKNSSMILTRSGSDSSNSLSAGTRIRTRLTQSVTLSTDSMPVQGLVEEDVIHGETVAIPKGSFLVGEATFDEQSEKARITWRLLRTPDGRERTISSQSLGTQGSNGISGMVRSNELKNAVGKSITTFIGGFARGSIQSGSFGAQEGGIRNGVKNAVSETAQDQAERYAEELKESQKWIELSSGLSFTSILTQPFTFRDPGGFYGG